MSKGFLKMKTVTLPDTFDVETIDWKAFENIVPWDGKSKWCVGIVDKEHRNVAFQWYANREEAQRIQGTCRPGYLLHRFKRKRVEAEEPWNDLIKRVVKNKADRVEATRKREAEEIEARLAPIKRRIRETDALGLSNVIADSDTILESDLWYLSTTPGLTVEIIDRQTAGLQKLYKIKW